MGHQIKIGDIQFTSKKSAAEYYKNILTKYEPNTLIDENDYFDLVNLLNYNSEPKDQAHQGVDEENEESIAIEVDDIYVNNHPVYKKTKCFYVVFGKEEWLFSYLLAINGGLSDEKKFYISCRNSIKTVLHEFKTKIFKNKPVRFAVTKNILTWETCQIDHKAPMTFSVIVKTFIKAKNIEVTDVDLSYENSIWKFLNKEFEREFIEYHNKLALLRVISTEENQKISSKARLKPTKSDFSIS